MTASTGSPAVGPYDLTEAFPNGFGASDGLTGWYAENIGGSASGNKMAVGPVDAATGALWALNDGAPGNGEALGAVSTTTDASSFGAVFVNNTGVTLATFGLSFTAEQWWQGATPDTTPLSVFVQLGGTGMTGTFASPGSAHYVLGDDFTPPECWHGWARLGRNPVCQLIPVQDFSTAPTTGCRGSFSSFTGTREPA